MIYVIHFDEPLGTARHKAEHYLGYCNDERDLDARIEEHRAGRGAKITDACNQRGIKYQVTNTMAGDRTTERTLKNRRNHRRLCPICSQSKHKSNGHNI